MINLPTNEMIRKMASLRNSFKFCEYIGDKGVFSLKFKKDIYKHCKNRSK